MKKYYLFGFVFFALFSCVKDVDCECVTTFPDGKTTTETHTVRAQNKKLASAACTDEDFTGDVFTKKCSLKKK